MKLEATVRVYEIQLGGDYEVTEVADSEEEILISDVIWLANNQLIYQAVTNLEEGGTFIYDLIYFDRTTGTEGEQLGINETVLQPQLSDVKSSVLYMKGKSTFNGYQATGLFEYHLDRKEEQELYLID